jgi:bifunctional DNA-binding transcriptional regulator/antitoxin component of YhaV-PrlF toxin-antitoxin module
MRLFENKGRRLQEGFIRVCRKSNGQFLITIPSKIARNIGLNQGDVVLLEENNFFVGFTCKKVEIVKNGVKVV